MPKGRKRTQKEYENEIEEAAKRMQKHPESLESARNSGAWLDFLDDIGIRTIVNRPGLDFWKQVRDKMPVKATERRNIYREARQAGMSVELARRIRDWSPDRAEREIDNWKGKY